MADDLRGWLAEVDAMGQLKLIERADWNLEIGAVTMLNGKRADAPALLFDKVKGYPSGYRIVTCSSGTSKLIAHMLGLPNHLREMELVELLRQKLPEWTAFSHEFAPVEVQTGPILENVHSAEDVDLFEFPVPLWHELDSGRYIGTGDAVITMDPDTGEVNLGTYRVMVYDKNTVTLFARPGTHGRMHYEKWHAKGKPCPVAISVGHHPLIFRGANVSIPEEYSFIGAITGKPVEVVRDEVTGLPIPAGSEIVISGWCPPGETVPEGPYGEWMGYYAGEAAPAPIVKIERVYHRNDPILLGAPNTRPRDENSLFRILLGSAVLHNWLEASGIPDVKGVWLSEAGIRQMMIVSLKQRYSGHAKQAAMLLASSRLGDSGSNMNRYVIAVDEDIDPSNMQDVIWAMCTRSDPATDIDIMHRTWSSIMDTMIPKGANAYFNSRAIIDACKPFERIGEFPTEITISPELTARVKEAWGEQLGL